MFSSFLYASAIICALACLRVLQSWVRRRNSLPFPPGPKGLPLFGNILDMRDAELWETAQKWEKTHGPLVHVTNLGASYVFVNSYETAIELFEKRGSIYSSRPKNTMLSLEGWEWSVGIMPYGDKLRRSRQMLHRFLQPAVVGEYKQLQMRSIHKVLNGLLTRPEKLVQLLRHSAGETIIMITYGHQVLEKDDPYIKLAEDGTEAIVEAQGFFLVNAFPALQYLPAWFPGAGFKRLAKRGHQLSMDMYSKPYKMAKDSLLEGTAAPSITSRLLDAKLAGDKIINSEEFIAKTTGAIYGAAADTTVAALHSFFLTMLLHPDVQQRAQTELDKVIGKDTLPTFEDRPKLPYIEAVIKETLRWQPIGPLGVAHTVDADDEYQGYLIPSGATILSNIWAMLRDPKEYPEPDRFIPERWLPAEGTKLPRDVHKTFFGFGRRICPGMYFADNTIFIGAASILSAFKISKALDKNGVPITPNVEYTAQFVRHPKPFKYVLTPRSEGIKTVIHEALDSAL